MIRLKAYRENNGYSQEDVAKILGVSRQAYGRYESGERECSFASLRKLSQIFHTSIDSLLGEEPQDMPYYSFTRSEELIDIALRGIEFWSDEKFLTLEEKKAIRSHFAELLGRYKLIIDATVNAIANGWVPYQETVFEQYKSSNQPIPSEHDLRNTFLQSRTEYQINELKVCANTLPIRLAEAWSEHIKKTNENRQENAS